MAKVLQRSRNKREYLPYGGNPNIVVELELPFGKDIIKPGDKIKFKNVRDTFTFQRLCTHTSTGSIWIDCMSETNKSFHSLRLERLHRVVKPRKKRKQKVV